MPSPLARAVTALIDLDRAASSGNRQRLRKAAEQLALAILERTRVGDEVRVGEVVYRHERVTWLSDRVGPDGQPLPDPHGGRALLRDDEVLVVADRTEHGRGRALQVAGRLARRPPDDTQPVYDLVRATDDGRLAFERDKAQVIEGFAAIATAREQRLTAATAELVAELVDYATR